MDTVWSVTRDGEINYDTWGKLPPYVMEVHQRWKNIFLENLDYKDVIDKWDSEKTLFYLDPPYVGVEDDYYDVNKVSGFNHNEMFDELRSIKGSYVVSYYDGDLVKKYEDVGCKIHRKDVKIHLSGDDIKPSRTEVLIVYKNKWALSVETRRIFHE